MNQLIPTLGRKAKLLALAALATPLASQAAIDVTTVTAGIAEVAVALTLVIGAFLAVSVAVLGLSKVAGWVKRKAGA